MAKRIFQKKKRRRRRLGAVLLCLAVLAAAAGIVLWALPKAQDTPPAGGSTDATQSTTADTEPRRQLPKEFIDRNTFSPYAVLYDATAGEVLYSKNADKKCYPASLTKLMTALVALDYAKPEDVFTIGDEVYMIGADSSRAYLTTGTRLTLEHLLDALLLPSGNDAAYAIAVQVGRLIADDPDLGRTAALERFCAAMNQKAKSIGCQNTKFVNPDGMHDEGHYTTAADMTKIAAATIENATIRAIVAQPTVTVHFLSGQSATWQNSNRLLLPDNAYTYEGAFGLKTGSTDEAGKCLAACATRDGRTTIAVVMGAESENGRWDDARGLLDLSFQ